MGGVVWRRAAAGNRAKKIGKITLGQGVKGGVLLSNAACYSSTKRHVCNCKRAK